MTLTSLWKGLALIAMILLISSEAYAQLPVRTQQLKLLGATSGALTQQVPAVQTDYYIQWPSQLPTPIVVGDTSILFGRQTATGIDMDWRKLTGDLVDGTGSNGFVAWWADANTLTYTNNFAWTGTALNIGTQNSTAAGSLNLGDGALAATTNVTANGATGTLTLGSAATQGTIVLNDGSANTVTIGTGAQTAGYSVNYDDAPAGSHFLTPSTNAAGAATTNFIYVSNGDGTGSWVTNPTQELKAGTVTPANGAYSAAVGFTTPYTALPSVTVTAAGVVANGYVLQVTGITLNGFTILSSAPFDGSDTISWMANAQYNP